MSSSELGRSPEAPSPPAARARMSRNMRSSSGRHLGIVHALAQVPWQLPRQDLQRLQQRADALGSLHGACTPVEKSYRRNAVLPLPC